MGGCGSETPSATECLSYRGFCQKKSKVALELESGRKWGRRAEETDEWRRQEYLELLTQHRKRPAARVFAAACDGTLQPDEARKFLAHMQKMTQRYPPNSSFSRFAQALAVTVGACWSRKLEDTWASPVGPSVSAGPSAAPKPAAALAGVPPPTEGFHDARRFPELDTQPVPTSQDGRASFRGQSPELIFYSLSAHLCKPYHSNYHRSAYFLILLGSPRGMGTIRKIKNWV